MTAFGAFSTSSDEPWRLAIAAHALGTFSVDGASFLGDARARVLMGIPTESPLPTADLVALFHVDDREGFKVGLQSVVQSGETWRGEVRCTAVDPRRDVAVTVVRVPGGGIIGVVEDVTKTKRVAESLTRAEAARDLIAGAVAHDLRAAAFSIILAADLVAHRDAGRSDEVVVRRLVAGARRLTMKVDELVYFARLGIGDGVEPSLATLDLEALAGRCVERATATGPAESSASGRQTPSPPQAAEPLPATGQRPTVAVSCTGDCVGTWDGSMIGAALLTLVDNALRHGKPAGVRVQIDGTSSDVTVSVHNQGVIQAELLAHLFELVRAPRGDAAMSGGLGLGLFNARRIVLAHRGEISVESTKANGTTFSIRLPRDASTPLAMTRVHDASEAPAVEAPGPPRRGQTLQERAPREFWQLLDRYTRLLDVSLHRRTFKNAGETLPDEVARLAEELGALHAGAREVADLHAQALRRSALMATPRKAEALVTEGRLLSLELMGKLLSYYRRRAGFSATNGDQT